MTSVLAALSFPRPHIDYHALAPELSLLAAIVASIVVDVFSSEKRKYRVANIASFGFLASIASSVSLLIGEHSTRVMMNGAYVVDNFAILAKIIFAVTGYFVLLMSLNYLEEGNYQRSEYSQLLLGSVLGMVTIASTRELISIFVALELLSIPAYMLAGWRKRDIKGNESMLKYYLLGVLSSAVMLYGMSLIYGVTNSTVLADINAALPTSGDLKPVASAGIFLIIVGFAFKVSAVPFHFWAPDTYEGAPTPITAFLSVASKTAGFVALMQLIFVGFSSQPTVWRPVLWGLAALTMTVGNIIALKQTNVVRMLAYSSVAQAGFMLAPLAAADKAPSEAFQSVLVYLVVYAAMNLGAFAVVITVARRTRSGEISSYNGLASYSPGLAIAMSLFMFSLAGIPPLGGWYAKFTVFRAVLSAGGPANVVLAVIAGVNSVIALGYYASLAKAMYFEKVGSIDGQDADSKVEIPGKIAIPAPLALVVGVGVILVIGMGTFPEVINHVVPWDEVGTTALP